MKLNKINHNLKGKLWCGIAALSAITGNPTQHSKDCIRLAIDDIVKREGRTIKGIYTDELLAALQYLCVEHKQIYNYNKTQKPYNNISLARYLLGNKPNTGKLYLIMIPHHFLVTDGYNIIDSMYPSEIPAFNYHLIEEKVQFVYELNDTSLDNL